MKHSKTLPILAIVILMTSSLAAIPIAVWGADIDTDDFSRPLDIFARNRLMIHYVHLGSDSSNTNGTSIANLTGTSIDTLKNYTFAAKISDRDQDRPNITFIRNITLVVFVNFEGNPSPFKPTDSRANYDHRNYEFQFNATRLNGGGSTKSNWNLTMNYPSMGPDAEVRFRQLNSSWINESDEYKVGGVPGTDTHNDTLEFRWGFQLGPQCRNTNSTLNRTQDDWNFYLVATDIYDVSNSSQSWAKSTRRFDVYQRVEIFGGGNVAGRNVPGGGAFKLDIGPNMRHLVHYKINNNATFWVNATNFPGSWYSHTLRVAGSDLGTGDGGWLTIGAGDIKLGNETHPDNGTQSQLPPLGTGIGESATLYWMCTGIPMGTASGKYTSTVKYTVTMDGT